MTGKQTYGRCAGLRKTELLRTATWKTLPFGLLAAATPITSAQAQVASQAQTQTQTQTQEQADAGPDNGSAGQLADIIVTGTKRGRGEALQTVPVAATALGEAQIRSQFTPNISDLGNFAPNVQLKAGGATVPGTANFYIRGTGVAGSVPSDDPAVAVVVDGMPLGSNIGVLSDTFDLEGVEIYRGPQGTLFGRNATGGAVVLRSRRPSGKFGVRADLGVGNYDFFEASGSIEGPVVENVSAKLAAFHQQHEGYLRNVTTGGRQGAEDTFLLRPMVRFKNASGLDLTLIGEYGHITGDGPITRTRNSNIPGSPSPTGNFETAQNYAGYTNVEWKHIIADLNFNVAGGVVTSITAYRKLSQRSASDSDGLSGNYFNLYADFNQHQFTQELRWSGDVTSFAQLTTGVFYFNQKFDYRERRQIAPPFAAAPRNIGGGGTINHDAAAVFAESTIDLVHDLKLVLGGRYTYEKKDAVISVIGVDCPSNPDFTGQINFAGCVPSFRGSNSWKAFTPKVGLNYRFSPGALVYATWSRGFRSGGFNVRSTNPAVVPGPYRPETVDAYEVGSKLDLLDRHLRINTAFFYNKFSDLQRTAIDNQARQTVLNAARATIWGAEGEVTAAISREFTLNGNVGYTNASYDSFVGLPPGATRPLGDLMLVNVPKLTWGVNANYSRTLGNGQTITARANYAYTDTVAHNDTNTIIEPSHDRVDASLTYGIPQYGLEISVFGKNLFNTFYNTFAFNIGQTIPSFVAPPRTFGLRLSYRH